METIKCMGQNVYNSESGYQIGSQYLLLFLKLFCNFKIISKMDLFGSYNFLNVKKKIYCFF